MAASAPPSVSELSLATAAGVTATWGWAGAGFLLTGRPGGPQDSATDLAGLGQS